MSVSIRRVKYTTLTAEDRPGSAYQLLADLADAHLDLLAFSCVPTGPTSVQFTLFPADPDRFENYDRAHGLHASPMHEALLVQGTNEVGAVAEVHRRLYDARVDVFAAQGVTGPDGGFGYVLYLRPEHLDRAVTVLDL